MTASWVQTHLPTILSRYDLRDIYNADEFGLFYQQFPTKSFHLKREWCAGGKFSKVRLTGLKKNCPCSLLERQKNRDASKASQVYLASTSPKESPGWILKYFLIM